MPTGPGRLPKVCSQGRSSCGPLTWRPGGVGSGKVGRARHNWVTVAQARASWQLAPTVAQAGSLPHGCGGGTWVQRRRAGTTRSIRSARPLVVCVIFGQARCSDFGQRNAIFPGLGPLLGGIPKRTACRLLSAACCPLPTARFWSTGICFPRNKCPGGTQGVSWHTLGERQKNCGCAGKRGCASGQFDHPAGAVKTHGLRTTRGSIVQRGAGDPEGPAR